MKAKWLFSVSATVAFALGLSGLAAQTTSLEIGKLKQNPDYGRVAPSPSSGPTAANKTAADSKGLSSAVAPASGNKTAIPQMANGAIKQNPGYNLAVTPLPNNENGPDFGVKPVVTPKLSNTGAPNGKGAEAWKPKSNPWGDPEFANAMPVSGTPIVISQEPRGAVFTASTDAEGRVRFTNLAPGDYVAEINGRSLAAAMDKLPLPGKSGHAGAGMPNRGDNRADIVYDWNLGSRRNSVASGRARFSRETAAQGLRIRFTVPKAAAEDDVVVAGSFGYKWAAN